MGQRTKETFDVNNFSDFAVRFVMYTFLNNIDAKKNGYNMSYILHIPNNTRVRDMDFVYNTKTVLNAELNGN